ARRRRGLLVGPLHRGLRAHHEPVLLGLAGRRLGQLSGSARAVADPGTPRVRLEWGPNGLRRLAPDAAVVVIVDVLSFTTSVDVALGRGATVLPYRWHDGGEHALAAAGGALVAGVGEAAAWTLRPATLVDLPAGTRLVLPSPNGSALSFGAAEAGAGVVLAGCLRNASTVAAAALELAGGPGAAGAISVIAAGERWHGHTGPLRVALEDQLGAGAVLAALPEDVLAAATPEAVAAADAFRAASVRGLAAVLHGCTSGLEKAERGQSAD